MGVHWKNLVFRGMWFHEKPIYKGDGLKRGGGGRGRGGGLGQFARCFFLGGLGKKEGGGVFEEILIPPMHTMKTWQQRQRNRRWQPSWVRIVIIYW